MLGALSPPGLTCSPSPEFIGSEAEWGAGGGEGVWLSSISCSCGGDISFLLIPIEDFITPVWLLDKVR